MPNQLYLADVFATEIAAGNPLAVVAGADGLDDTADGRLGREFNQSETTLLLRPTRADADWRLRCFTPIGVEVFGAGHNALGAWWWLAASGRLALDAAASTFSQEIGDRVSAVEVSSEAGRVVAVGMIQAPPAFGAVEQDPAALAATLGFAPTTCRRPSSAAVVSTDASHLLVVVRDRGALAASGLMPMRRRAAASLGAVGCYVFCLDPVDPRAIARASSILIASRRIRRPAARLTARRVSGRRRRCRRRRDDRGAGLRDGTPELIEARAGARRAPSPPAGARCAADQLPRHDPRLGIATTLVWGFRGDIPSGLVIRPGSSPATRGSRLLASGAGARHGAITGSSASWTRCRWPLPFPSRRARRRGCIDAVVLPHVPRPFQ